MPNRSTSSLTLAFLLAFSTLAGLLVLSPGAQAAVAGPDILAAEYKDLDHDGRIDAVTVTFNEDILDVSIRPSDFTLSCTAGVARGCLTTASIKPFTFSTMADPPADLLMAPILAEVDDGTFTLVFDELLGWRTNARPELVYGVPEATTPTTALAVFTGSLVAAGAGNTPVTGIIKGILGGNLTGLPLQFINETDAAPPVLWGATTDVGKNEAILAFSEPVIDAGGNNLTIENFLYDNDGGVAADCVVDVSNFTTFPTKPVSSLLLRLVPGDDCTTGYDLGELVNDLIGVDNVADLAGNLLEDNNQHLLPGNFLPVDRLRVLDLDVPASGLQGALADEGATKAILHFNAPVTGPAVSGGFGSLGPGTFQFIRSQPPGANIREVDYSAGSDVVGLFLSDTFTSADLGQGRFQITDVSAIIGPKLGASTYTLQSPGAIKLLDLTGPRVTGLQTLDADEDGLIDAFQVSFSESVDDDSFAPDGSDFIFHRPGPDRLAIGQTDFTGVALFSDNSNGLPKPPECRGPDSAYQSTGLDDPVLYICIQPDDDPTSNPLTPLEADGGTTGLLTLGNSPFCSRLRSTDVCAKQYLPTSLPTLTLEVGSDNFTAPGHGSNDLRPVRGFVSVDKARPSLLGAVTQDRDNNGRIDAYALLFSEPIADGTLSGADFHVDGHNVAGKDSRVGDVDYDGVKDDASKGGTKAGQPDTANDGINDEYALLLIQPGSDYDTDQTPDLSTPSRLEGCCVTRDAAGNVLVANPRLGNNPSSLKEVDFARPVIVHIDGAQGLASVDVFFSEDVRLPSGYVDCLDALSTDCNLPLDAFAYANGNGAAGATAINSVGHSATGTQADHATLLLDHQLTGDDTGKDRVAPAEDPSKAGQSLIRQRNDVSGGFFGHADADFLRAPVRLLSIGAPPDVTPPGAITNLEIVPADVGNNKVGIRFTAPGDDGDLAGNAFPRYDIRASTTVFTAEQFANLTGYIGTFVEGNRAPGQTQAETVSGLASNTTYFIAVQAVDDGRSVSTQADARPNRGPVSNIITVHTLKDDVRPGQVTLDVVSEVRSNRVVLSWTAPGDDGFDPLSGVVSNYVVKALPIATLTDETTEDAPAPKTCDQVMAAAPYHGDAHLMPNAANLEKFPDKNLPTDDYAPANSVQYMVVKGLTPATTYCFSVWALDHSANEGPASPIRAASTVKADVKKPGAPTPIKVVAGATSVDFSWTAPADDAEAAGALHGVGACNYQMQIKKGNAALTALTPNANEPGAIQDPFLLELPGQSKAVRNAFWALAPGQTQHISFHGLQANTDYAYAVRAVDCAEAGAASPNAPNLSDLVSVTFKTLESTDPSDVTPPCAVRDASVAAGPGLDEAQLQFIAPGDDCNSGVVTTYFINVDGQANSPVYSPSVLAESGRLQVAALKGLPAKTSLKITITAADDNDNRGPTANLTLTRVLPKPGVEPFELNEAQLREHDLAVQATVTTTRSGDVVSVRWSDVQTAISPHLEGYQIWCADDLSGPLTPQPLPASQHTFNDDKVCEKGYLVTSVFEVTSGSNGQLSQLSDSPHVGELQVLAKVAPAQEDGLSTTTMWLLIAGGLFLIAAVVVLVIVLRRRGGGGDVDDGEEPADGEPPAAPEAAEPPAADPAAEPAPGVAEGPDLAEPPKA